MCKVKFDLADVACPVVSLGKMIEPGFTFSFDEHKCHMHRSNQRVEIFRKGRIFVLKMRRRWLESKAQMVAPIDKYDGEGAGDDYGEGAGDASAEPRSDEPGDDPSPPHRQHTLGPKSPPLVRHHDAAYLSQDALPKGPRA